MNKKFLEDNSFSVDSEVSQGIVLGPVILIEIYF